MPTLNEQPPPGVVAGRFTPAQGDALPADVESALRRGNKIEAIRLLRGHTGLGLKEAKDTIDAAAGKLKIARDGYSPGEVRESSWSTWVIVIAIVIAAVAYYFLYGSR